MKEKIEITGRQLFLRYAYPCVEQRVRKREISERDAQKLKSLIAEGKDPDVELLRRRFHIEVSQGDEYPGIDPFVDLLRRCFPLAVSSYLGSLEIDSSIQDYWSLETVRKFWRRHEGPSPECAVMRGEVTVANELWARVNVAGRVIRVINLYGLPVKRGDIVYFHQQMIVEIGEETGEQATSD